MPQLLESHEHSGTAPKRVRSGVVTPFVNECFEGEMLFFVRDPSLPVAPKQRDWELQVQGRFRKRVENLYMGMELTEPLKVSFVLRGLAPPLLPLSRASSRTFYSRRVKGGRGGGAPRHTLFQRRRRDRRDGRR